MEMNLYEQLEGIPLAHHSFRHGTLSLHFALLHRSRTLHSLLGQGNHLVLAFTVPHSISMGSQHDIDRRHHSSFTERPESWTSSRCAEGFHQ
jgi:hypothetical protein